MLKDFDKEINELLTKMSLKERGIYMLNTIVNYISGIINAKNEYMYLTILTLLAYITLKFLAFLIVKVYMHFNHDVRSNYLYNQKINIVYKVVFFTIDCLPAF